MNLKQYISGVEAEFDEKFPDTVNKCCDECWNSKHALNPRNEEKRRESGCGLACDCHRERAVHLPTLNGIPTHSSEQKSFLTTKLRELSLHLAYEFGKRTPNEAAAYLNTIRSEVKEI